MRRLNAHTRINYRDPGGYLLLIFFSLMLTLADYRTTWLDSPKHILAAIATPFYDGVFFVAALFNTSDNFFSDHFALRDELEQAQLTISELEVQLSSIKSLQQENNELRTLINVDLRSEQQLVIGELVSINQANIAKEAVINRGTSTGIAAGHAIINAQGLLGQVASISAAYSKIILVNDIRFGVPVEVLGKGIRFNLFGKGTNLLESDALKYMRDIAVDDLLITSGLGHVFPRGIEVALVVQIHTSSASNETTIQAQPVAKVHSSPYIYAVLAKQVDAEISAPGADSSL